MGTAAAEHQAFESFYKDVRGRLLLQTWALTGDLSAAQKAVRDALVIAWHHWRKVRRLDPDTHDREDWVRPLAWSRAQRRHSVPHFHRDKDIPEDVRATLAALGKLTITQRKVLLLAHLSAVSLEQLAREVAITQPRAERELQAATAAFSAARGLPASNILTVFEPMGQVVAAQRWPRSTILTRAGSTRRRTHTVAGVAAAVAALVGSGFFVAHEADSHPGLRTLALHTRSEDDTTTPTGDTAYPLGSGDLLDSADVAADLGGRWTTTITADNKRGTGLSLPCQRARSADPRAEAALARSYTGPGRAVTAGQATEASASSTAAKAAYQRALQWYAGCQEPRVQLLYTRSVTGVGDEATVIGLRNWNAPERAVVVGVARTGALVTSVATTVPGRTKPALTRATKLLGTAVERTCTLPGHGACATKAPRATDVPALPVGKHPALLGETDLPPVTGVTKPWVGTAPAAAHTNLAATRCDQTSFDTTKVTGDLTRTFVIPTADHLDPAFGLTETVGRLGTPRAAAAFVATIRDKLGSCSKRELGSHVTRISTRAEGSREVSVWRVVVETSKTSDVTYLMAVARQGDGVAQLGFVPSKSVRMNAADFVWLADRAADRLAHL